MNPGKLFALTLATGLTLAVVAGSHAKDREKESDGAITVTTNKITALQHQPVIRASQLIGKNIVNHKNESVGEIHDIVLDTHTGTIRYAAVTYGGFLGVGDKLFAVPFQAFEIRHEDGDVDDYTLVLNVTQKQLEGAEGFDSDHWPTFTDEQFTRDLDKRYGVDVNIGNSKINIDVKSDRK